MYSHGYSGNIHIYFVCIFHVDLVMDVKKFYGKRFHNLSAATDYIESSDRSHFDFAIIPPNTHCDTDEEDIEEDNILRDDIPTLESYFSILLYVI